MRVLPGNFSGVTKKSSKNFWELFIIPHNVHHTMYTWFQASLHCRLYVYDFTLYLVFYFLLHQYETQSHPVICHVWYEFNIILADHYPKIFWTFIREILMGYLTNHGYNLGFLIFDFANIVYTNFHINSKKL